MCIYNSLTKRLISVSVQHIFGSGALFFDKYINYTDACEEAHIIAWKFAAIEYGCSVKYKGYREYKVGGVSDSYD